MRVDGVDYRTIWLDRDGWAVVVIDQTLLPHRFETRRLEGLADAAEAIRGMVVRGAPLIGVTAAYGMALAMREDPSNAGLAEARARLMATRPTAVNLAWALADLSALLGPLEPADRAAAAYARAAEMADEDVEVCRAIGEHGAVLLSGLAAGKPKGSALNVLTHCNAGWLATVDWGTALAPIYRAHNLGMPIHVWVDETRPRNQGASLTAWELGKHGVAHTIIADNAGGHLMQRGLVDAVIVGTDRTTATGDVCNKIGTYLKALAARDCRVPFFVALPFSTIDWTISDGLREIPIEQRDGRELSWMTGRLVEKGAETGGLATVAITAPGSAVRNDAFDVTPARMITALVTERGVCKASRSGLLGLYPERSRRKRPRVVA